MTTTTADLTCFGFRELGLAAELLNSYCESPPDWMADGVHLMMNTYSGNVFLTDEDYNVAMMNGGKLDAWLFTPYHGYEGFIDELTGQYAPDDLNSDDVVFIRDWAQRLGLALPENWQQDEGEDAV